MTTATAPAVKESYDALIERSKEAALLGSTCSLLHWDKETYMPPGGAENRANQLALLAGIIHDKCVDPVLGERLSRCEASDLVKDGATVEAVNVRELRRMYDKETKLPKRLVEELVRTSSLSQEAWVTARKESDYGKFLPWLEKLIKLTREKADCWGYDKNPYDALLDEFEPYETCENVSKVFAGLQRELVGLIERIAGAPKRPDKTILIRSYPVERQVSLCRGAAAAVGFDFQSGRIDTVVHPFCSGIGPGDTRITTRYNERFLNESFFGTMHETGHALYDQGLPREHYGTPMGSSVSLAIHESQSRMWENFVGRSRAFWTFFLPETRKAFPEALGSVGLDAFVHAVNTVEPSYIRVEADEATYNLHIVLRFELEQALVSGKLAAKDLPEAWNKRFKELLGIAVPDDRRGCLQDVHWSFGHIGYFATYTLGNLYAAQFFAQARKDLPGLEDSFAKGDFRPLLDWLRRKIHCQGMRLRAGELVREVTDRPLGHADLIAHLKAKFEPLYGL
ncbi:MAG: carboxypeptidase M32 [Elusimicrobia bacterium]|nr:carboxypeptidase M32 [Elusimicrobiota bacterium]